jgi:hypothetical protein
MILGDLFAAQDPKPALPAQAYITLRPFRFSQASSFTVEAA